MLISISSSQIYMLDIKTSINDSFDSGPKTKPLRSLLYHYLSSQQYCRCRVLLLMMNRLLGVPIVLSSVEVSRRKSLTDSKTPVKNVIKSVSYVRINIVRVWMRCPGRAIAIWASEVYYSLTSLAIRQTRTMTNATLSWTRIFVTVIPSVTKLSIRCSPFYLVLLSVLESDNISL